MKKPLLIWGATLIIFGFMSLLFPYDKDGFVPETPFGVTYTIVYIFNILVGIASFVLFLKELIIKILRRHTEQIVEISKFFAYVFGYIVLMTFVFKACEPTKTPSPSSNLDETSTYFRDDDYTAERSLEEYGDMDCTDFDSWSDAQEFFEETGGPEYDYHNLDADGDGIACESL